MATIDLERWVRILESSLPAEQNGILARLAIDDDGVELGLLPLDGVHPAELLDGFEAPPEWWALGVVSRGWTSQRRRIVATMLVDRDGTAAGRVIDEHGAVLLDHPPPEGVVPDLLRAALGGVRPPGAGPGGPRCCRSARRPTPG